ncbi:hypothetical protein DPMN_122927 [Dreissena polymorpha]|uniref:Uncharacterized protein n=1 Tax=Dreissena polymorpha TaxID=45954 RepID=A0A9D4JUW8_DREPO|nr:hypothetical protein DPMN_122927 [Dreissena polymorpha]
MRHYPVTSPDIFCPVRSSVNGYNDRSFEVTGHSMTTPVTVQPLTAPVTGQLMTVPLTGQSITDPVIGQLLTGPVTDIRVCLAISLVKQPLP